jgi:hypothetical protein
MIVSHAQPADAALVASGPSLAVATVGFLGSTLATAALMVLLSAL